MGKSVLDFQRDAVEKRKQQEREAKMKAYQQYQEYKKAADEILEKEPNMNKWTGAQLKIIVRALKRKGDPALGKKKKELLEQYMQYKDRPPMNNEELLETNVDDVINTQVEEDDDINEMMESEAGMI